MKNTLSAVLLILLASTACKKQKLNPIPVDDGCISRVDSYNYHYPVTSEDSALANHLFEKNRLDYVNKFYVYRVVREVINDTETLVHVASRHHINGLVLFDGDIQADFRNEILYNLVQPGNTVNSVVVTSTGPSLTLQVVRKRYIDRVAMEQYKDTCLYAELGYYNSVAPGGSIKTIKAWKVHPEHNPYPVVYIADDNYSDL